MSRPLPYAAIVVAAGTGSRMGGEEPKQFRNLGGKAVLRHSVDVFSAHAHCGPIIVVTAIDQAERAAQICADVASLHIVTGGDDRRQSVLNGLETLAQLDSPPAHVMIHDAARPGLSHAIIDSLQNALQSHDGALPALTVSDSVARADNGVLSTTVDREALVRVQTPQAFDFAAILTAHRQWPETQSATDDARMLMAAGGQVAVVEGDERLMKLTHAADFKRFADQQGEKASDMRIGKGYDVHRLQKGEELWLCGVRIDHSHGLAGHSDADVAIHALCDALFGALGEGDIGSHFPPSDDKWRGAASKQFLTEAMSHVRARGLTLANCDLTIICEAPKIGPHREAMRDRLARIMQVERKRVSVKATTTEGLGFTGRGEGIAAEAIVLLAAG